MNYGPTVYFCGAILLLTGCTPRSPIDAKKTETSVKESSSGKAAPAHLTDKDIFGNEATLTVTEEDIQAALEEDELRLPLHASVILVQSGSRAPETAMQQAMEKYFTVATFSGIPDRQKPAFCGKDENGETVTRENANWMQAMRYVAAKGHQQAIIIYQETLQSGRYDSAEKNTVWTDYKSEKITNNVALRYLVRFTLVDVATGKWASWSPVNTEDKLLTPLTETTRSTDTINEELITQLKKRSYRTMANDLVNRYQ
ncbi:hypothetical protein ABFP30_001346 [Enterobacter bugandensis]